MFARGEKNQIATSAEALPRLPRNDVPRELVEKLKKLPPEYLKHIDAIVDGLAE